MSMKANHESRKLFSDNNNTRILEEENAGSNKNSSMRFDDELNTSKRPLFQDSPKVKPDLVYNKKNKNNRKLLINIQKLDSKEENK